MTAAALEDEMRAALKQNDMVRTQQLIADGFLPHVTLDSLSEGATCLHVAAMLGYVECVGSLIRVSGLLSERDAAGWTALFHAVEANQLGVARLLLQRDTAATTTRDTSHQTALHVGARCGNTPMTQLLLNSGFDVDAVDDSHMTPLLCAVEAGFTGVARCLYASGASYNVCCSAGKTALHFAAEHCRERLLRWLMRLGCNCAAVDIYQRTPLMLCVQQRRVPSPLLLRLMNRLVSEGSPLNVRDVRGNTALLLAVGNEDAIGWRHVKLLLGAGADADVANRDGLTPLWQAVSTGVQERVQVVRVLLQHNCRLDAACRGTLLFTSGLNSVYCYESCLSSLEVALHYGRYQLARLLILAGCRVRYECPLGVVPAELQWYRQLVANPRSLQHMCRIVIRRILGAPIQTKARSLPLPDSMKYYILLQDLLIF